MTFSVSGRCADTGMFGIAVSSSSPSVAARCAHVRAGIGAVSTQNVTDPRLGPKGLDLMAGGLSAEATLARLVAEAPHVEYRQLALVDAEGRTAAFSGAKTLGTHAFARGNGVVAAGNMLTTTAIPQAMVEAFEAAEGRHLGDRLIAAMRAAVAAGGEEGPVHSMGLVMVDKVSWNVADLRVDWTEGDPIEECAALWQRWRTEMDAYVTRALDPTRAPSYGVPGDL
ncbi:MULTISPECIES: DUF1028 domain-containing protein [unclassified Shinella]|uniref:DUF1028 domain-containing protein n=1 Tax=unclassified Shinella TaxID=2643062 RepID=UPI00225CE8B1|nr:MULTISPECIES: DUF1028 domain-containing protein [unclassified Shinella]MCO5139758.1 DUF1028 domain-containing protein [Shinella sp.]MDC7258605.1 DUF1028 domain-containing protein [Shinella sp. YE25]CAI0334949.1 conserved hypothetical protein [Rhizobiaceae bacterium]CAK7260369.1 Fimbrial assembly protein FimA [Shinella sp. WSC3-e]